MSILKKLTGLISLFCLPLLLFAQEKKVAMADTMRSEGRIYVVIAVMVTILIGLLLYVFRVDRKLTRLEKEVKNLDS